MIMHLAYSVLLCIESYFVLYYEVFTLYRLFCVYDALSQFKENWFWQKNMFSIKIIFSQRTLPFCKKRLLLEKKFQAWKWIFYFFSPLSQPQIHKYMWQKDCSLIMPTWDAISFFLHRLTFPVTVKHTSPCLAPWNNCHCSVEMSVYMHIHIKTHSLLLPCKYY